MATPVVEVRMVFTVMDGLAMQICPVRSAFQMRWWNSWFLHRFGWYVYPYAPASWQWTPMKPCSLWPRKRMYGVRYVWTVSSWCDRCRLFLSGTRSCAGWKGPAAGIPFQSSPVSTCIFPESVGGYPEGGCRTCCPFFPWPYGSTNVRRQPARCVQPSGALHP